MYTYMYIYMYICIYNFVVKESAIDPNGTLSKN